jgi:hypothetical protein
VKFTFIDPDLSTFQAICRNHEGASVTTFAMPVQDVPLSDFDALASGDILFVDSSHVAKTGSDVNRILFEILPRLRSGVFVHVHDVHYPFEYPRQWVYEGRAWNEAYLLRAFLEFNDEFEIVLFASYLATFHHDLLMRIMPMVTENAPGSLWLRRR